MTTSATAIFGTPFRTFPGAICEAHGMANGTVGWVMTTSRSLLRRRPDARVVEFVNSGHSIQGDESVALIVESLRIRRLGVRIPPSAPSETQVLRGFPLILTKRCR